MKNENLINLSEEIRKINYRVDYKINESPKYRPLVSSNEEFDKVPILTNEAGEQEDAEKPGGGEQPPAPSNDQPIGTDAPIPAFDKTGGDSGEIPAEPMTGEPSDLMANPMGAPEPDNQVNDVQNEIIKHNIEAMKSIHDQLEGLNNVVQGINTKLEALNADVQEVREPTNSEKLMNKTNVSYPYYFNLNDFWSGNWFNEKRNQEMEKGIKELPDGTFVADFDDLPQKSKTDVQNSFNDMI
jgi:hypothetical protein